MFASVFVGWDLATAQLFPKLSIAWRHGLLTAWAGIVSTTACGIVFYIIHRNNRRLAATAERLSHIIGSLRSDRSPSARFDNPHRVHCRDVLGCERATCPMYDTPEDRCWQIMALRRWGADQHAPRLTIEQCLRCEVYARCCPDELTLLGESFNNLMFLLDQESRQVGRMRAQMVEKEKMVAVGQIAAGVAHEIGNPLSSISSIVQMTKRKGAAEALTGELDLIETHIQRISGTVRQLVSLARPGGDQWELVDIGKTLDEAVHLISFDRRARDIHIDLKPHKELPQTYGLRGQLHQVFINLGLNALDAMPDGGTLTVHAGRRNGRIVIRVSDTGCGIPAEIGRRVFEPFFTTKQPGQGTGLGLAVSYGIIQKHGGEIGLFSAPNEGTTFTVEIPVLDEPPVV